MSTTTGLSALNHMETLAAEVAGILSEDGSPNRWNGYDFQTVDGETVRLYAEDAEAGITVATLDAKGWITSEATFGGIHARQARAIAAYVRTLDAA